MTSQKVLLQSRCEIIVSKKIFARRLGLVIETAICTVTLVPCRLSVWRNSTLMLGRLMIFEIIPCATCSFLPPPVVVYGWHACVQHPDSIYSASVVYVCCTVSHV